MTTSRKAIIVSKRKILRGMTKDLDGKGVCYYLCDDYSVYSQIKKKYDRDLDIHLLGSEFHNVIEKIKMEFLSLSHRINNQNASYAFWGTHLASRNSSAIPLLKNIVYFQCAKNIIANNNLPIIFICDSPALIRLIKEEALARGMKCQIHMSYHERLKPVWIYCQIAGKGSYYLLISILIWFFSRLLRNKRITKTPERPKYILRSWVTKGSIDNEGNYQDRNFGVLPVYLSEQGKDVWTIPLFFNLDRNIFSQIKLMSESGYQFIFPEQYLSLLDITKTLRDGIKGLFLNLHGCEFDGHDIKCLIMENHRSVCLQPLLLSYNSIKYLLEKFSKRNIRIDKFIYPFENNSSEKPFLIAIRQYYPKSIILGFQHTVWLKEQMAFSLIQDEIPYHPLPDHIICSGKQYRSIFEKTGFPIRILLPGPNLRYTAVNRNLKTNSAVMKTNIKKVLIILNYETNHNLELLNKTGNVLRQMKNIEVFIKSHPVNSVKRISSFLRNIHFPAYEWASGSVQEWILKSDVVCMTGGSVSNLETMARGVPLIRLSLENNFDFDCLWNDYPFAPFVCTVDEIRFYLQKALKMTSKERNKLIAFGENMIKNYFEPVTKKNLEFFL